MQLGKCITENELIHSMQYNRYKVHWIVDSSYPLISCCALNALQSIASWSLQLIRFEIVKSEYRRIGHCERFVM